MVFMNWFHSTHHQSGLCRAPRATSQQVFHLKPAALLMPSRRRLLITKMKSEVQKAMRKGASNTPAGCSLQVMCLISRLIKTYLYYSSQLNWDYTCGLGELREQNPLTATY